MSDGRRPVEYNSAGQPPGSEAGPPRFGRLLVVLVLAVLLITAITFTAEAYYS